MDIFTYDAQDRTEKVISTRYFVKRMQPSDIFEALLAKEGKLSRKAWFKTTVKEIRGSADTLSLSPEALESLRAERGTDPAAREPRKGERQNEENGGGKP